MTMTVAELIEELERFDPDMEVKFAYDWHDYWGTQAADSITSVTEEYVEYSDYHRTCKVISEVEDEENTKEVVVIA